MRLSQGTKNGLKTNKPNRFSIETPPSVLVALTHVDWWTPQPIGGQQAMRGSPVDAGVSNPAAQDDWTGQALQTHKGVKRTFTSASHGGWWVVTQPLVRRVD